MVYGVGRKRRGGGEEDRYWMRMSLKVRRGQGRGGAWQAEAGGRARPVLLLLPSHSPLGPQNRRWGRVWPRRHSVWVAPQRLLRAGGANTPAASSVTHLIPCYRLPLSSSSHITNFHQAKWLHRSFSADLFVWELVVWLFTVQEHCSIPWLKCKLLCFTYTTFHLSCWEPSFSLWLAY